MDQEQKDRIAEELQQRVTLPCLRCGAKEFTLVGQTAIPLNEDPRTFRIGGPAIPAAIVACAKCGFLSFHALGALGLMHDNREKVVQES